MPTGNEFEAVVFGQNENSYKQTDREMEGLKEVQVSGPNYSVPLGNYPNTFDREAGSEPLALGENDYYPDRVFEAIPCTGPGQSYKRTERESVSGEYGQVNPSNILGRFSSGDDMIPDTVPSKQFSSNKEGDPKKLVRQATDSIDAHSDLNNVYGLHQPDATIGSHPWLRDELAVTSEKEPSNAEPFTGMKVPERSSSGR